MQNSDCAIRIQNLSKVFFKYAKPRHRLQEMLRPVLGRLNPKWDRQYADEFWALRNIDFEIKKGEAFAVIGRNGAGKSTLLQIIAGTMSPTEGNVEVNGRINALLELGSGFNPEFTGKENVYMNGSILGFSKEEIDSKYQEIWDFSEIGEFIHQPVKTYSSGMFVRLAFAVQALLEPDILIVDEALSVGDAGFQAKSFALIRKIMEKGTTLLFVSHDPGAIQRLCHRTILLGRGRIVAEGKPDEVLDLYNAMLADPDLSNTIIEETATGKQRTVSGTGEARVSDIYLQNSRGDRIAHLVSGDAFEIHVHVQIHREVEQLVLGFMIKDRLGQVMLGTNTSYLEQIIERPKPGQNLHFIFNLVANLGAGDYSITTGLTQSNTHLDGNFEWRDFAHFFKVSPREAGMLGLAYSPVGCRVI